MPTRIVHNYFPGLSGKRMLRGITLKGDLHVFLADDIIGMLAQLNQEADQLLLIGKANVQNVKKGDDSSQPTQSESAQIADSQQTK